MREFITPEYIKSLRDNKKSWRFCNLFEYPHRKRIEQQQLVFLLQDAWKLGMKVVGEPQQIYYYEYRQSLGDNVQYLNIDFVEIGNIRFCFNSGHYIIIKVKVDEGWINIHDNEKGWIYPIGTKAIQEVLIFLKTLADEVEFEIREKEKREKAIKESEVIKEANERYKEYNKNKDLLDKFELGFR